MIDRRDFLISSLGLFGLSLPGHVEKPNSFIQFAEGNFKINHWKMGIIPYEAYKHHKELADIFDNNRFVLVKKYRQGGFSTMSALYALYNCITKPNFKCVIFSKYDREAKSFKWNIIDPALGLMPNETKPHILHNNNRLIDFSNGSKLQFAGNSLGCGIIADLVILDEAAFMNNDVYFALSPCVSPGGKIFLVSTPNTPKGFFYKIYKDAIEGKNNYCVYAPSCFEHPYYAPEIISQLKESLGEKGWKQECLAEFI